jgi:branched-chain amino acid transport system substrate-binding protein
MKLTFTKGAAALAATAFLATTAFAQDKPLRIGAVIPNTGGMAVLGNDLGNWYEIAVQQRNAKGGLLGRKIELVRGDAVNPQEAIAAVERLVGREGTEIVVGTIASSLSQAASEAALSNNVLFWETGSLAKDLTERGLPNFVRSGPSTVNFAKTAADAVLTMLAGALGKAPADLKVWMEHESSNYGTSLAEEQQRVLKEAGVKVERLGHAASAVDLTDSVLRAKKFNPDIWIISGYVGDTHLLLRTAREQGFAPSAVILVGLGDSRETVEAIGQNYLQGILVVTYPRHEVNPNYARGADELSAQYVEKYRQQPVGNSGFGGYVGLNVLFNAIEAAKTTKWEAVVAAAKTLDAPVGTFANGYGVRFDEKMQNTRANPIVYQWQGDKTVAVFPDAARKEGVKLQSLARP